MSGALSLFKTFIGVIGQVGAVAVGTAWVPTTESLPAVVQLGQRCLVIFAICVIPVSILLLFISVKGRENLNKGELFFHYYFITSAPLIILSILVLVAIFRS
jgi:hypothetical protein